MKTDAEQSAGPRRPPCPDPIDDLAGKFERCGRFITYRLGRRGALCNILWVLGVVGCATPGELPARLDDPPGSMSEIAAKLEGRGLLERFRDGADRRKIRLRLTDQGRQWLDRQDEDHVLRRRAELFSALTGEERRTLEELLEKLGEDWTRRFARERPPEERGRKKKDSD